MRAATTTSAVLVLLAVAASCSSSSARPVDAAGANDVAQTSDVGQTNDIGPGHDVGQAGDVAPEVPAGAVVVPPDNVMFPEAPVVTCSNSAADCPFPPSACADPSCDGGICAGLPWVVYYDSPTCVNGKCAYEKKYFECGVSSTCNAGGCRFNGTLAAPQ